MALIKRADADSIAREAVSLHLGDLEQQGESLVAEAKTRAESILAKGRAERDLLIAGAAERGYKAGYARGHAEGLETGSETGEAKALEGSSAIISSLAEQWGVVLGQFEQRRETMLSDARVDIVRLAAVLAAKAARRAVELDPTVIERTLDEIARRVIAPSALIVSVHPGDLDAAQRKLPELLERIGGSPHATITPDESVTRGGCVVRTDGGGLIDAEVEREIDRLVGALLPDDGSDDREANGTTNEDGSGEGDEPADETGGVTP